MDLIRAGRAMALVSLLGCFPGCGQDSSDSPTIEQAVCGNGVQESGEVCDDGNTATGDYCAADCASVTGFCGDGLLQTNEVCDQAGDTERCDGNCRVKPMLTAGEAFVCGLRTDGSVICWGREADTTLKPPEYAFVQISAGSQHACGIEPNGAVRCWGVDGLGETKPPDLGPFQQVSAGRWHSCALKPEGRIQCWGAGTTKIENCLFSEPYYECGQSMPPAMDFVSVSASSFVDSCGLKTDGGIVCWGYNTDYHKPPEDIHFTSVVTGANNTCGLDDTGQIICWGHYEAEELLSPPQGSFKQISVAITHACAVAEDGHVACWGSNHQVAEVPQDDHFIQVAAGYSQTCGLGDDGSITCWGAGEEFAPPITSLVP
jgi:cysteine-rich repeat protein